MYSSWPFCVSWDSYLYFKLFKFTWQHCLWLVKKVGLTRFTRTDMDLLFRVLGSMTICNIGIINWDFNIFLWLCQCVFSLFVFSLNIKVWNSYDYFSGFEHPKEKSAPPDEENTPKKEILETEDMEISNSPWTNNPFCFFIKESFV